MADTRTVSFKVMRLKNTGITQRLTRRALFGSNQSPPEETFDFTASDEVVLRQLIDDTYDGVALTTLSGKVIYANARLAGFMDMSVDVLMNSTLFEIISGANEETLEAIRDSLANRPHVRLDAECRQQAGVFPAEIVVNKVTIDEHELLLFFIRNITRRLQEEEATRQNEERCSDILDNMADWFWEVDAFGVYMHCSPGIHRTMGLNPQNVVGQTIADLVAPDTRDEIAAQFAELASTAEVLEKFELDMEAGDGSTKRVSYSGFPVTEGDGTLLGYRGVAVEL